MCKNKQLRVEKKSNTQPFFCKTFGSKLKKKFKVPLYESWIILKKPALAGVQGFRVTIFLVVYCEVFIPGVLIPGVFIPGLFIPGVIYSGVIYSWSYLFMGVFIQGLFIPGVFFPGVFIPGVFIPSYLFRGCLFMAPN